MLFGVLIGTLIASMAGVAAFASVGAAAPTRSARSRPGVMTTSPRPGPAILYARPARAPQLENAPGSPWLAPPILVSGSSAYRDGEFLYQDYLFDDRGAGSTYTYPTDPRYARDAADLVEFRLRPYASGLLIRLTYNAMIDPSLVASTIAIGDSAAPEPLPFDADAKEPAQYFVTVHGTTVVVTDAATGQQLNVPGAMAGVDLTRRQVQVFLPSSVINTDTASVLRVASASGLWDNTNNQYLQPGRGRPPRRSQAPTARRVARCSTSPSASGRAASGGTPTRRRR